jgi:excisionase family DNA binding protein
MAANLRLLTIDDAAERIGVPTATVYKLVSRRLLASTRLLGGRNARIYIRETDLLEYLEARRQAPACDPPASVRRPPLVDYAIAPAQRRFS